ncbi:MAG TPA: glycosyltransferase family 2 protein [Acidisarcina sp.]
MLMIVLTALGDVIRWVLLILTLPLLIELFGLTLASLLPAPSFSPRDGTIAGQIQRLVVLIPSHNEETCITRCIDSLLLASSPPESIIVIAHNCTDSTAQLARSAGVGVFLLDDSSRGGKGHALQAGLNHAFSKLGAEAVLIVDADSTVSSNMVPALLKRLATAEVVQCRYQVRNHGASWRTKLVSLAFLGMNVIRPRGRDRLGLSCGIFGNGFALRKEVLDEVPYTAHSIVEDLEFHLKLVEHGFRVRFIEEALVLADMPLSGAAAASQHARWEGGRVRLLSDWWPKLLQGIVRGKFTMLEPLIDLLGVPLGIEVLFLLLLLLLPGYPFRDYGFLAFAIVLFHLAVVVYASPDRKASLQALARAPIYLFWRVSMVPSIIRASRSGAAWIRTHRDSAPR